MARLRNVCESKLPITNWLIGVETSTGEIDNKLDELGRYEDDFANTMDEIGKKYGDISWGGGSRGEREFSSQSTNAQELCKNFLGWMAECNRVARDITTPDDDTPEDPFDFELKNTHITCGFWGINIRGEDNEGNEYLCTKDYFDVIQAIAEGHEPTQYFEED